MEKAGMKTLETNVIEKNDFGPLGRSQTIDYDLMVQKQSNFIQRSSDVSGGNSDRAFGSLNHTEVPEDPSMISAPFTRLIAVDSIRSQDLERQIHKCFGL